jgi:serine/threonine protein kinase
MIRTLPTGGAAVSGVSSPLADLLRDRYTIDHELGHGGMAVVYLARDLKHDRPVALKVLRPGMAASLGPERFLREIRLTARLEHPHILPLLDSGNAAGQLWYTMPYVRGETLRERMIREVQLPVDEAVHITREIALALDYAHRQGIVHRDIKPENILLCEGQALAADFGVAKALGEAAAERLTETGLIVGTAAYMSPEQAAAGLVDARTDIYALGCVLYEMLAGEAPLTGPTGQATLARRLAGPPPSLRIMRPDASAAVDAAMQRALAPLPDARFGSAGEFARALSQPLSAEPAAPPPGRRVSAPVTGSTAVVTPQPADDTADGRRARGGVLIWIVIAAILMLLLWFSVLRPA